MIPLLVVVYLLLLPFRWPALPWGMQACDGVLVVLLAATLLLVVTSAAASSAQPVM